MAEIRAVSYTHLDVYKRQVNGIGKYNAQAAVSAGLHHRIPEAGTDGHSHLADNIPPFVPDQIQIL